MLGGFLAGNFMVPAFSRFPLCRCVFLPLYDRGVLLSAAHFAGMVVIHGIICGGRAPDCGAEKYPRKNYRAVLWGSLAGYYLIKNFSACNLPVIPAKKI